MNKLFWSMLIKLIKVIFVVFAIVVFESNHFYSQHKVKQFEENVPVVFQLIEESINSGDFNISSDYFSKKVNISLNRDEEGFFSNNQTIYLLKNYFTINRVSNFRFTTINKEEDVYYGTGGGVMIRKGKQVRFQIYMSVSRDQDKWKIVQFNVY